MSLYGSCKSIGAWGSDNIYMSGPANIPDIQSARRDMVTGSVVVAAIVMFIWTGRSAMSAVVRRLTGLGAGVEQIMMTALLLNIALLPLRCSRSPHPHPALPHPHHPPPPPRTSPPPPP